MSDFDVEVEKLSRKMCEELGTNPEPDFSNKLFPKPGWRKYENLIRDWLEMEVFNRIRRDHWDFVSKKFKEKEDMTVYVTDPQPQLLNEEQPAEDHDHPSLHNWGTEGPVHNEEH